MGDVRCRDRAAYSRPATVARYRPGDLGYFIGFRIAESLYARTSDKRLAVRAIIDIANSDLFLSQSGYSP